MNLFRVATLAVGSVASSLQVLLIARGYPAPETAWSALGDWYIMFLAVFCTLLAFIPRETKGESQEINTEEKP